MATMVGVFCASLGCFFIVSVALVNRIVINRSVTDQRPVTTVSVPSSEVDPLTIDKPAQLEQCLVTEPPTFASVTLAAPVTARKHPEPLQPSLTRQTEMFLNYCANEDIVAVASGDAIDMYFDMCVEYNLIPHAKKTFLAALGKRVRKTQWRVGGERPRIYLLTERVGEFMAQAA